MKLIRITDAHHQDFKTAFELYEESFPIFERRILSDQIRALTDNSYHFDLVYDNELLGIALYWEQDDYIYLEHIAINKKNQGKNYGTKTIELLQEKYKKIIILEIDLPIDEVSHKRKVFYERLNFIALEFKHLQPPYRFGDERHELLLMSSRLIDITFYEKFASYLNTHIVKYLASKR